jgi:hypothetical protein
MFYLDDGRRLRLPASSIAWEIVDGEPGSEVPPPSTTWELASVVFRAPIPVGGTHVQLGFWSAEKHPDIQCVETEFGVRLTTAGVTAIIPWGSIAVLTDRAVTLPPSLRTDDPAAETTSSMPPPPRRAPVRRTP